MDVGPETEFQRPYNPARQSILEDAQYHPFKESEFQQGKGYCDLCGGGPDASVHQKPVDQMARIADALERIANQLEAWSAGLDRR
jgi:hypothetical protein